MSRRRSAERIAVWDLWVNVVELAVLTDWVAENPSDKFTHYLSSFRFRVGAGAVLEPRAIELERV